MLIENILKANPVKTALVCGKFQLMYDPVLEKWIVMRGAGRKINPVVESENFYQAFDRWLQLTKQNVIAFPENENPN